MQTAATARAKLSEFMFYLAVFFGLIHFAAVIFDVAGQFAQQSLGKTLAFPLKSSMLMGNTYLAMLAAYVGEKEFRRWMSAPEGDALTPAMERKISRGLVIVGAWAALFGVVVLLRDMGRIGYAPEPLIYTFGEVVAIYFGTNVSKYLQGKSLARAKEADARAADYSDKALALARATGSITNETCQREFNLSRDQAYRLLEKLEKQGMIKCEGSGPATKYVPAANATESRAPNARPTPAP